ncbi:MAG: hypothetical protein BJ554DRAFT_5752 [Olpidium bornovanus]|uniref:Uncharacterized protein n=1 Tax=Olpidium bornovanus TaxID=278681 RepID=A0A8H8DKR4_9FUNG|nr:MAG: hypothetical protein BJ554DRAFT_5752 [Olpidium bornovanus]
MCLCATYRGTFATKYESAIYSPFPARKIVPLPCLFLAEVTLPRPRLFFFLFGGSGKKGQQKKAAFFRRSREPDEGHALKRKTRAPPFNPPSSLSRDGRTAIAPTTGTRVWRTPASLPATRRTHGDDHGPAEGLLRHRHRRDQGRQDCDGAVRRRGEGRSRNRGSFAAFFARPPAPPPRHVAAAAARSLLPALSPHPTPPHTARARGRPAWLRGTVPRTADNFRFLCTGEKVRAWARSAASRFTTEGRFSIGLSEASWCKEAVRGHGPFQARGSRAGDAVWSARLAANRERTWFCSKISRTGLGSAESPRLESRNLTVGPGPSPKRGGHPRPASWMDDII